jgi:hypothetical protein
MIRQCGPIGIHTASDFTTHDPPILPLGILTTCHHTYRPALRKNASAVALIEYAQFCECGCGMYGPPPLNA